MFVGSTVFVQLIRLFNTQYRIRHLILSSAQRRWLRSMVVLDERDAL